jgi:hypothetical protein
MSLIPVDAEYHYVQDTAPSGANAGDVWLDTSVNPPIAKIYADVGNGLEWLQDQSSDRIAQNLDAPVSSAGTTQNTIADGADESEGRWTRLQTPLTSAQPTPISVGGSGATPVFQTNGAELKSSTSGDGGWLGLGGTEGGERHGYSTGAVILRVTWSSTGFSSLSDDHLIGYVAKGGDLSSDDIAVFAPSKGANTSGNVRVDSGGTDTNGQVDYGDVTREWATLTLLLDIDGIFISAGSTGFYVNGDPRRGDQPDEVIASQPGIGNLNGRIFGVRYVCNGNFHGLATDYLELSRWIA